MKIVLAIFFLGIILNCCLANAALSNDLTIKTVNLSTGVDMKMIHCLPGQYVMGGFRYDSMKSHEIESIPHVVSITGDFWLGAYEVTIAQYDCFVKETGNKRPAEVSSVNQEYPIGWITWFDAVRFCNWISKREGLDPVIDEEHWVCDFRKIGYRLPTEAEWEYACRAGTKTNYYWGESTDDFLRMKNPLLNFFLPIVYSNCETDKAELQGHEYFSITPAAAFRPNQWGFYDMANNLQEWCLDWYAFDYYLTGPQKNPPGPKKPQPSMLKISRGGWLPYQRICASYQRMGGNPEKQVDRYGFRVLFSTGAK